MKGLRLHQGDDAVAAAINGSPHMAWVTAGRTDGRLLVQVLDADLRHESYPLLLR